MLAGHATAAKELIDDAYSLDYLLVPCRHGGLLAGSAAYIKQAHPHCQVIGVQEAVEAATEAHRVVSNRYAGGLANYLEVLTAEDSLLGTLSAQTNLRAASIALDVGLQRALGGGYQVASTPATTLASAP